MDELNAALQKVARGTGIIFFGGIIGAFIGFISKTLVARSFERSQYGTFNLALTVISIGAIIALMGLLQASRGRYPSTRAKIGRG